MNGEPAGRPEWVSVRKVVALEKPSDKVKVRRERTDERSAVFIGWEAAGGGGPMNISERRRTTVLGIFTQLAFALPF